ncbi:hypothetical protein K4K54_009281 [Colletotrichum sp. SAR 10_86]|nr:hypothetical protein K4K54_009281 [Colletotrichum sp. SAR 10_86]
MVEVVERLAAGLFYRHGRTGSLTDLAQAIEMLQQICNYPPSTFSTLADRTACLANQAAYIKRYSQLTSNLARLADAEQLIRQAINEASGQEDLRPQLLHQLGLILYARCEADWNQVELGNAEEDYSRIMNDLTEAMEKVQLAVDSMPEDHLEQASTHRTLGLIYMLRGGATESLDDIKTAIALFTKSWHTTSSAPRWRLQSAGKAIWLSMAYGDSNDAIALGREVMGLLPVLNTKDLTVSDRQDVLGDFEGIAMNVCAALLKCDKAKEALQFLEQGRAVLIRQLLDDRLDLSDLEMQDPDLVRRYQEIAKAIEEPISNIDDGDARETARRRRQESLRELDHLMRQISQIPGYAALFAELCQGHRPFRHRGSIGTGQLVDEEMDWPQKRDARKE